VFYDRFLNLARKLKFKPLSLKQNLQDAADLIMTDRKHLDYNPKNVTKDDIVMLLKESNSLSL
jgi:succinate semialdehyde reductase